MTTTGIILLAGLIFSHFSNKIDNQRLETDQKIMQMKMDTIECKRKTLDNPRLKC